MTSMYDEGLGKNEANYAPLTPLTFIERAAYVYPDRLSVVHGTAATPGADLRALPAARLGAGAAWHRQERHRRGDAPNTPAMYEAHFGVPMCGAVLNTLNTRLDAETIAFMLRHGGARVLIADREFSPTIDEGAGPAGAQAAGDRHRRPGRWPGGELLGAIDVRSVPRRAATPTTRGEIRPDEWDAISLNYTSGTTGDPKGVVYHHRGAYLNAISNILELGHAASRGVSVDAADVPLQRLVLSLDDGGARRRQRLPAPGRGEGDVRRDPRQQGDAHVRRADRLLDADQRAGGVAGRHHHTDRRARSPAPRRPPR